MGSIERVGQPYTYTPPVLNGALFSIAALGGGNRMNKLFTCSCTSPKYKKSRRTLLYRLPSLTKTSPPTSANRRFRYNNNITEPLFLINLRCPTRTHPRLTEAKTRDTVVTPVYITVRRPRSPLTPGGAIPPVRYQWGGSGFSLLLVRPSPIRSSRSCGVLIASSMVSVELTKWKQRT